MRISGSITSSLYSREFCKGNSCHLSYSLAFKIREGFLRRTANTYLLYVVAVWPRFLIPLSINNNNAFMIFIGVWIDTYVFYQSILQKKTYESQIWSLFFVIHRKIVIDPHKLYMVGKRRFAALKMHPCLSKLVKNWGHRGHLKILIF